MCSSNVNWADVDGGIRLDKLFRNLAEHLKRPTSATWVRETLDWWDK